MSEAKESDAPKHDDHDLENHNADEAVNGNAPNPTINIKDETVEDSQRDTNGDTTTEDNNKKRKSQDDAPELPLPAAKRVAIESANGSGRSTPAAKKARAVSPPWKLAAAEGPTSVIVDGKRKSTRTNVSILTPPPSVKESKRSIRGAKGAADGSALSIGKGRAGANGVNGTGGKGKGAHLSEKSGSAAKSKVTVKKEKEKEKEKEPRRPVDHTSTLKSPIPLKRLRRDTIHVKTPAKNRIDAVPTRGRPPKSGDRRSSRLADATANGHHERSSSPLTPPPLTSTPSGQRLKLRFKMPVLQILHPDNIPKPKKYGGFDEWLKHDDPLEGEKEGRYTDEEAQREAELRIRILEEAKPGGLLSEERLSTLFPQEKHDADIPMVYGHWDHATAHALHFRQLLQRERRSHIFDARKTAIACQTQLATDKRFKSIWDALQSPLSEEEIFEQEKGYVMKRYKQLVKDLELRWEMVKAEVNKIRMERWEEEQQRRGKEALDEMLDKSTALLDQRRYRASSELDSDEEEDDEDGSDIEDATDVGSRRASTIARSVRTRDSGDEQDDEAGDSDAESSDPDNMSSSDDEEEEAGAADEDMNLSPEALRRKYSQALEKEAPFADNENNKDEEEADEGTPEDETDGPSLVDILSACENRGTNGVTGPHSDAGPGDSGYSTLDPAAVEVEEVDPMLLDESDDSGSPTEDESDDEGSDEGDVSDDQGEEEDEDDGNDLWGFFSKTKRKEIKEEVAKVEVIEDGGVKEPVKEEAPDVTPSVGEMEVDSGKDVGSGTEEDDDVEELPVTPADKARVEIPSVLLRGTLRPYQHDGLDWLAGLYANSTNGILADEMGLGKTIQTISLLAHLAVHHEVWGPHLVVVPTSVMLNWEMEFKKWCPGFKILTYYGTQDERKKKRAGWMNDDKWNVVITSYQLILQDAQAFKKRPWHYLILDEAHNIKNFQTQRWQTLLTFKTHSRLLLTGTPLQNNLTELWSLLFFLMPTGIDGSGGFAELEHFINATRRPADQILEQGRQKLDAQAQAAVTKLHEVLRPYLLRRLKADVEKQMPGKYEHVVYCRLSKRQRQLYDTYMGRADTRETLSGGNYMSIINCLMNLRKVCNHPDLFETRQIVTSFAMNRSAITSYEIKEFLIRKRLLEEDPVEKVNLNTLGLNLVTNERQSRLDNIRTRQISAVHPLEELIEQRTRRLPPASAFNGSTLSSITAHLQAEAQQDHINHLQRCLRLTQQRIDTKPVYGTGLIERLTVHGIASPIPSPPKQRAKLTDWYLNHSSHMSSMIPTLSERAFSLASLVQKFGCTTPAVVANDMPLITLTDPGIQIARGLSMRPADPFADARIKLSIQFPDKRLLQYDCGKLQRLDVLLRELQSRGSRALIFTQMTKVLDILESFLNIHGHRYLRLDGSTKIEQRQILTDRFNNDPRILCFILSSRSGGLGINLTGADTVIFYDLDWNPAMDKQCQDRCHRIGQTRDVHIYRFVSEFTIEANILRKSNQKRLLDDVIIQKGEFTTDYFNRVNYRDALDEGLGAGDEASAAMDRVLGDVGGIGQVLESVEDKEDAVAAKQAEREMSHMDDEDFSEEAKNSSSATPKAGTSVPPTPGEKTREQSVEMGHVDDYMVRWLLEEYKNVPIKVASDRDRRRSKKGKDFRRR